MDRTATCSCGELRARCRGAPVRVSLCSCHACKQRTGSAFSWNATYDSVAVATEGAFSSYTRHGDSGRWATFHFCPACGATVFYAIEARPGMVSVPVGGFKDETFPAPTVAVHANRREDWLAFGLAGPREET